jgi:hypothetical protein
MSDKELLIKLLEMEIAALRSVISELSEDKDVNCLSQWHAAEAFKEAQNHVKR